MYKSVDNGYLFTKDNQHNIFKSAYSLYDDSLTEANKIIVDGVTYYFGTGVTCTNVNKIYDITTMICTLADLSLTGSGEYNIVVGLPLDQYKDNKDSFRDEVLSYSKHEVVYRDKQMNFKIQDVAVCPQGVGALYSIKERQNCIIFDIGSFTINIALFEQQGDCLKLVKSDTIFHGVLHLFEKVIKAINTNCGLSLDVRYADIILRNGLEVDGVKKDISYLRDVLFEYLSPIISQFKTTYPYQITPIFLCGGGAILLKDIFTSNFYNVRMIPNAQFANADGYYQYGLALWR